MFRVRLLLVAFFHPTLFVFGSSAMRGAVRCSTLRANMMENWSFRVNKTKSNMWQEGESRTHTQSSEERLPSIQTDRRDLMKNPHAMHVFNSLIELHQGSRSLSEFAPSLGRSRILYFFLCSHACRSATTWAKAAHHHYTGEMCVPRRRSSIIPSANSTEARRVNRN